VHNSGLRPLMSVFKKKVSQRIRCISWDYSTRRISLEGFEHGKRQACPQRYQGRDLWFRSRDCSYDISDKFYIEATKLTNYDIRSDLLPQRFLDNVA